jgi:hypothetical protein
VDELAALMPLSVIPCKFSEVIVRAEPGERDSGVFFRAQA